MEEWFWEVGRAYCVSVVLRVGRVHCVAVVLRVDGFYCVLVVMSVFEALWVGEVGGCSMS